MPTAADLVVLDGRVLTMTEPQGRAEAVAVAGDRILAVGSTAEMRALAKPGARIVDAEGGSVLPGFIESHMHLFPGAAGLGGLEVDGCKSVDQLAAVVRPWAAAHPDAAIVYARRAYYDVVSPDAYPTRHDLDRVIADRPFAIHAFDGHTVWANTRCLEVTGLIRGKALPPGNEVVMGADGLATGELREGEAFDPILGLLPTGGRERLGLSTGLPPDPMPSIKERALDIAVLKRGLAYCASLGITSIHNMDGNTYLLELLEEIERDGALAASCYIPFHMKNTMQLGMLEMASEMARRWSSATLKSGFVKVFMDGVLESGTAQMLEDYADIPGGRGDPLFTAEQFDRIAVEADRRGLQIAVHAIGDGAVRRTLDGYAAARAANGTRDSRHRIEHVEVIHPDDIGRFAALGVIASMQPTVGLGVPGVPMEPCRSRIGPDRMRYAYAWRTMRRSGARVAFSSDWPVSPLPPMLSIQAALTRRPAAEGLPEEKQSLEEALAGYTRDGAYAEFAEASKGRLAPGLRADIVVMGADLERTAPDALAAVAPRATISGGRVTFGG